MANLNAAIRHLRRVQENTNETSPQFARYRDEYETILEATAELAGDPAFDDLKEWMVETTREQDRLPAPSAVRRRAREICTAYDVTVPKDSQLRG